MSCSDPSELAAAPYRCHCLLVGNPGGVVGNVGGGAVPVPKIAKWSGIGAGPWSEWTEQTKESECI
jgi:hypothetical protein